MVGPIEESAATVPDRGTTTPGLEELTRNYGQLMTNGSLFLPSKDFFDGIQDAVKNIPASQREAFASKKKRNTYVVKNLQKQPVKNFHKLYAVGAKIATKCREYKGTCFPKLPSKFHLCCFVCGKIYQMRREVGRADVNSGEFPDICGFVAAMPSSVTRVYLLEQRQVMDTIFAHYGVNKDDLMKPTQNDRARLFGVLITQGEFREMELPTLLEGGLESDSSTNI